jgi:hypothetical protein
MSAKDKRNSKWHKSQPRPRAWWLGAVKEEKPTKKAENPAAKNAAYSTVYNVLVGKNSVGLTFSKMEAEDWRKRASPSLNPVVVPVHYSMPR